MSLEHLSVKQFRRLSPSRYTAMQACLLREVWAASDNEPLIPPSPLLELGSIIHHLLEAAGRGQLGDGGSGKVEATWDELILQAEKKMTLSSLRQHQVPLSRIIPDFEVRKLRACRRVAEIAHNAVRIQDDHYSQLAETTGFELWVESDDGLIGGFIDRVKMTKDGVVLSDYKSGAVLDSGTGESPGHIKRAYRVQLELYAALYHSKYGVWPVRLEVVPLQGSPVEVVFDRKDAEHLLSDASTFLHSANKRIAEIENESAETTELASPQATHCRFCLFRPACQAYWNVKRQDPQKKWPADVQGFLREMTYLRNGKVCMIIAEDDLSTSPYITIRNLMDSADRHPHLHRIPKGSRVAIYGLKYHFRTGDYTETHNTFIYRKD